MSWEVTGTPGLARVELGVRGGEWHEHCGERACGGPDGLGAGERKEAGRRVRERWGTAGGREDAGVTELDGPDGWGLESGKGRGDVCGRDG
jgi:hypothetical protein